MHFHIFASPTGARECLFVPVPKVIGDLPGEIADRFSGGDCIRQIEVSESSKLTGLNSKRMLKEIETHGYYIAKIGLATIDEWQ